MIAPGRDGDGRSASTTVWVVDAAGMLRTRHLSHAILPGCTRASLIEQMAGFGYPGGGTHAVTAGRAARRPRGVYHKRHIVREADHQTGRCPGRAMATVGPVTRQLFALFARHVDAGVNTRH